MQPDAEREASDEPLTPEKYDLKEYNGVERKMRETRGFINVLIDDAARERANESHQMLTDLVAAKIRKAGGSRKEIDSLICLHSCVMTFISSK